MQTPRRSARRAWIRTAVVMAVVGALVVPIYAARLALISLEGLDNAGVPSADSMRFPEGTEVLSTSTECASGGCRAIFNVRPPEGSEQRTFAKIYLVDRGQLGGTLWDPRVIYVSAEVFTRNTWVVQADYWTGRPG